MSFLRQISFFPPLLAMLLLVLVFTAPLGAQELPTTVSERDVDIYSEGTRMQATVFTPTAADGQLPAILMAHGWGGVAALLRRDAIAFAEAGYLVITFDYRGWGRSDGRVIAAQPLESVEQATQTLQVQQIREVVDPVDMLTDWQNALHWLHGEPQVDRERIGVWGSSQSGGYVVEMAARDPRITVVHSQVGSMDGRAIGVNEFAMIEATRRARGELGYPEPGATVIGDLRGAPISARFANYKPVERVNEAGSTPIQFVLAGNEELFDNREHGILAHDRYEGPKRLIVIPDIGHYGIYREAWSEANRLALEWFDRYLK